VTDLREGAVLPVNDLYLIEPTDVDVLFISREHFLIDYENGTFVLVDRGSVCGTLVGARRIGGDRTGGRALLRHRDKITIGNDSSPYVFRFDIVVPAP
jgi:pSer/pThr/pTyr-binding forkhead associated (FHA) protein